MRGVFLAIDATSLQATLSRACCSVNWDHYFASASFRSWVQVAKSGSTV